MEIKSKIKEDENRVIFWLNSKIYPLEAIYSTAYVFIDDNYIHLDGDPREEISVSIKGKEDLSEDNLKSVEGEFKNELLNYLLRVEIAERNKQVRDFIVGTALVSAFPSEMLSSSDLETPEIPDGASWEDDPLGIGKSWEEKEEGDDISVLDLPKKIETNLKEGGVKTVNKLKQADKDDLLEIEGIGEKSVEKILEKILKSMEDEN